MTTALKSAPALEVEVAPRVAAPAIIDQSLAGSAGKKNTNRIKKSMADFDKAIIHYPEAIRTRVSWLQAFWLENCKGSNTGLRAIAIKAGFDRSEGYYYNLLNGQLFKNPNTSWKDGSPGWNEFLEIYTAIRRYADQAARQGRQQFVETPTYGYIADFITARRALHAVCKFGGIMHATGAQTTACLKHYTLLNNHGAVIRVECPADQRINTLKMKIGSRYGIPETRIKYALTRDIALRENVNETRTIIFDNAQHLYIHNAGWNQPMFNWLLELQEDTGFTPILNFTTDFADQLTAGRASGYFEQFIGRMGGMQDLLRIPDFMPEGDLRAVAEHYHVESIEGLKMMRRWSRQQGRCRILFQRLQRAQEFAKFDNRENITVADLREADTYTPPAKDPTDGETEGEA